MIDYRNMQLMQVDDTCVSCGSVWKWEQYMAGAVRANKVKINCLIKQQMPDLYKQLCLEFRNPYNYFRTKTHLVVTWSAVEYFIRYTHNKKRHL